MPKPLNIVVLEPYYGGSHAAFCDALETYSRHNVTLVTLPARKWKWRMRGAALWFVRDGGEWSAPESAEKVDLILCNDMLSVADLRARLPTCLRDRPIVCYFHENQLTYPLQDDQTRDFQYGMTNITSCLAADEVWFNSRFHLDDFLAAAQALLAKMPDYVPGSVIGEIRTKSQVLPPPVPVEPASRSATLAPDSLAHEADGGAARPVTILWCHRWEYDKNPEPFFDALVELDNQDHAFQLVLLGERFRTAPSVFTDLRKRLAHRIVRSGYVEKRADYLATLRRCDLVVSTAIQENFGIAVVEAMLAGCQPLLPNRLSYPELIPGELHAQCLYPTDGALRGRLSDFIKGDRRLNASETVHLQKHLLSRYGAKSAAGALDDAMTRIVNRSAR